jgi:DNA-binding Lrp family transcriptional regulator
MSPERRQQQQSAALKDSDVALVEALQRDGRRSFTVLAEELGASEASIRRRVKALVDADVIAITAVADPRVFGLDSLAWLGLAVEPAHLDAVAEAVTAAEGIDYAVITSGEFNVMAEAACASMDELYELVASLRALAGVTRTETFVYLRLLHQRFQWSRGEAGAPAVGTAPLEPLDVELIQALQRDGRASFRELGRELGVSERAVSTRYADLVEQNSVRVTAVVNPLNLGWDAMAWLGIRLGPAADLDRVAEELSGIDALSYLVVASGRYDLMGEVVCRDPEELLGVLTDRIGAVEGVAGVELFHYLRLLYRTTAGAWSAARSLAAGPHAG